MSPFCAASRCSLHVDERSSINIIAKPEIGVSRINPYHVAVNPDPSITGSDGRRLLDAAGNPQTVSSAAPLFNTGNTQSSTLFNHRDFDLERRLLISYFDRNHRFRSPRPSPWSAPRLRA